MTLLSCIFVFVGVFSGAFAIIVIPRPWGRLVPWLSFSLLALLAGAATHWVSQAAQEPVAIERVEWVRPSAPACVSADRPWTVAEGARYYDI